MAPLSRIHATATEVSRPPENAMPTRSPFGSEVRTLLTVCPVCAVGGGSGVGPRRRGGEVQQSSRQQVAVEVPADHQDGVVSGDGAEHSGELRLVECRCEE